MKRLGLHLATLFMLVAPVALRAEVRLARTPEGTGLQITSTRDGVWTPSGRVTTATLNPLGDRSGDGYPSAAWNAARVLVAWSRPDTGLVAWSIGVTTWSRERTLWAGEPSDPRVAAMGDGWLVAWTDMGTGHLEAGYVHADGRFQALDLDSAMGVLLTVVPVGDSVQLVSVRPAAVDIRVLLVDIHDDPIVFATVSIDGANLSRLTATKLAADSPGTALTWWTSPTSLSYVELTEGGPVLPVRTLSANGNNAKYPQSLVNEALRDLGR